MLSSADLRARTVSGAAQRHTLPGAYAALMRDSIATFPALRAHQRHAWHAFMAQIGALALHAAALTDPPQDEDTWRALLLALAPEEAWSLIGPPDRPALLQPPLPDGLAGLKNAVGTPDHLDILITSRNHDLKREVMVQAGPDDWLFSLVSLQTMQGYSGRDPPTNFYYGISRMNGGSANRAAVGLAPPGGPGAHLRRDMLRLLALRDQMVSQNDYAPHSGLGLVWMQPWDGVASLSPTALDPFYVEICRRVRLLREPDGRITARAGSSKVPRIGVRAGGLTGDPWAPLRVEKDGGFKVLTVDSAGFGYRRVVELLFPGDDGRRSLLQDVAPEDPAGSALLLRALVRGQGKTEGYHERRVPLSRRLRLRLDSADTDRAALIAHDRVRLAGELQRAALRPALMALFQNGPDRVDQRNDASGAKAEPFLASFDHAVDSAFFPQLWQEAELDDGEARHTVRSAWLRTLLALAESIVLHADHAAPKSAHRRYRARVRALAELQGRARNNQSLAPYLASRVEETAHDPAA